MRCASILIAEDNDDIRETIADVLVSEGYKVHLAKNGREAITLLAKIPAPALVLLDLMMPVMSGWEFLDAQRTNAVLQPHPVLVISAVPATQSLEDETPLQTVGSLLKPLDLGNLLDNVRKFCGPGQERVEAHQAFDPGEIEHALRSEASSLAQG